MARPLYGKTKRARTNLTLPDDLITRAEHLITGDIKSFSALVESLVDEAIAQAPPPAANHLAISAAAEVKSITSPGPSAAGAESNPSSSASSRKQRSSISGDKRRKAR